MRIRTLLGLVGTVLLASIASVAADDEQDELHSEGLDDLPVDLEALAALELKLTTLFMDEHSGDAKSVFSTFDRNNDGQLGHKELAHIMKTGGVGIEDGGRHELALATRLALDANANHKLEEAELQLALDCLASFRAAHGSITAAAAADSPFVVAAEGGDVDFFRTTFGQNGPYRLLVESWREQFEMVAEKIVTPGDLSDVIEKGDRQAVGRRKKDGVLQLGEIKGLLKREYGMKEGGPIARHFLAGAIVESLDLDSDRAVSLAELAQAHGTIARVAAVGGGSLWKALVEFAFEQPSSAWTDFVATVTDQAVLSVLTDGPAKPEDAWRVIDAWAAYAGGTGAAGGEL